MKKNRKKIISIMLLLCLIFIILVLQSENYLEKIVEKVAIQLYGEPIDLETSIINNRYFNIQSNGTNAKATTEGINKAIQYASQRQIEYIKLEQGTYLIEGLSENYEKVGIILQDNIKLDLNGSIIRHNVNSSQGYSTIIFWNVNNASVSNGILIGDKEEHEYTEGGTHEWGHGIVVKGSSNIQINNLEIYNMTGDGIYLTDLYENGQSQISENIEIKDCNIHDCRRQGMTIICAQKVDFYNNEIHHIGGTSPEVGIDIESNLSYQKNDDINIYGNKFYDINSQKAIIVSKNTEDITINENEINASVIVYDVKGTLKFCNNEIKTGKVHFVIYENRLQVGYYLNKIIVRENNFIGSWLRLENVENALIEKNTITTRNIYVKSTNAIVCDNKIQNTTNNMKEYAYYYSSDEINEKQYKLYIDNNVSEGNYINHELLEGEGRMTIIRNRQELEQYKTEIFGS